MKGGTNKLSFAKPEVNQTTSSGAIQGAMFDQKENNTELTNINKEIERLEAQISNLEGRLKSVNNKIENKNFISNAPKDIVNHEKNKKNKYERELKILQSNLKSLKV